MEAQFVVFEEVEEINEIPADRNKTNTINNCGCG
ncbi:hypothetical protein EV586_103205 [Tumebacillus sp. BK434]|nr:hypothetical protein EV586_103205 [Tumebacillus sp. BK434]